MKIKRINIKHEEAQNALLTLQQICLPYDRPHKTNYGDWWLATDEGNEPVAFAGLIPSSRWADTGYLCRAGVISDFRGKGIQKRLIRVRIRQAYTYGWKWIITDTYENPASANSLIACGFKLFDPTKPWGDKGTLYWRFKLKD